MSSSAAVRVLGVGTALPPHYADQETLIAAFRAHWSKQHFNIERLEELHRAVQVGGRYLALPVEEYERLERFSERNGVWIRVAQELGEQAIRVAADRAGIGLGDVDHLFFVTVTGIATPSVDALLMNRLRLRPDVKRTPIFGLGCVAGAAGLARAADYVRGFPGENAVLVSVELCSLTFQREDLSIANIIASGLFGDGAAALMVSSDDRRRAGPRVVATRSVFYPGTERMMGWDLVDTGFKVVLSSKVPDVVRAHVRHDVDAFLGEHGLDRSRIRHWVAHTGGPKVLRAFEETLELPPSALERSWRSLRETGNLSSASVLFVLDELLRSGEPGAGDYGLLAAMGPGFCSELVLLQW
jgi:alkylresorcinol/alkylpyrone synthase